jgi:hypothetical protein
MLGRPALINHSYIPPCIFFAAQSYTLAVTKPKKDDFLNVS